MNCIQFQFVTPKIDVDVNINWTNGLESIQINGKYTVEQVFSPSNRVKYALAMGCFPYDSQRNDKKNWQPWSSNAFCGRFSLNWISYQSGVYIYPFYMGNTPIYGTSSYIKNGVAETAYWSFYLNSDLNNVTVEFIQNNYWYIHERLKPWDDQDPFYPRAVSMYNKLTPQQKQFPVTLVGVSQDPEMSDLLIIRGTMAENATDQTVFFQYGTEIIGTADVKMSFKRQKVQ